MSLNLVLRSLRSLSTYFSPYARKMAKREKYKYGLKTRRQTPQTPQKTPANQPNGSFLASFLAGNPHRDVFLGCGSQN